MPIKRYFTAVISSKNIDKNAKAGIMVSNNGILSHFSRPRLSVHFPV